MSRSICSRSARRTFIGVLTLALPITSLVCRAGPRRRPDVDLDRTIVNGSRPARVSSLATT